MVLTALTLPANLLGLLHSHLPRARTPVSFRSLSLDLVILSKAPTGPGSNSHGTALPSHGTHPARPMCKPTAWPSCVTTPSSRKSPVPGTGAASQTASSFLILGWGVWIKSGKFGMKSHRFQPQNKNSRKKFTSSSTESKRQCEGPPCLTSLTKTNHTRVKQNKGKTRYYCYACEGSPAKSHSAEATWENTSSPEAGSLTWVYFTDLWLQLLQVSM